MIPFLLFKLFFAEFKGPFVKSSLLIFRSVSFFILRILLVGGFGATLCVGLNELKIVANPTPFKSFKLYDLVFQTLQFIMDRASLPWKKRHKEQYLC